MFGISSRSAQVLLLKKLDKISLIYAYYTPIALGWQEQAIYQPGVNRMKRKKGAFMRISISAPARLVELHLQQLLGYFFPVVSAYPYLILFFRCLD
jgi:hypothetical protein